METGTPSGSPEYSIGSVARMLGVSVATVRLYERRGLILVRKTEGNRRYYSDQDIDRLRCIRAAIVEHKISIEGIRTMQSFVPCWTKVACPPEQRSACPAFTRSDAGCWTYKHRKNACAGRECRSCRVYVLSGDCGKIKELLHHTPELREGDSGDCAQRY